VCVGSVLAVADEDFRVEVELDDEARGYSLRERLRALDLDDEARKRLGRKVVVTRDGSKLFLYAVDEAGIREAEKVIRGLVAEEQLTADFRVTRWHPVAEEWKDLSVPLPRTAAEERAESAEHEAAERREAEDEGEYDWQVVVHLESRDEAHDLAERLAAEGTPVARRWHYVVAGAVTEARAQELAERLRVELPAASEITVEANVSDVRVGTFQFIGF
jgi:hypothetical protein